LDYCRGTEQTRTLNARDYGNISEAKQKEINIHAIKNGWTLNGTIESKILLMVFSMASEI